MAQKENRQDWRRIGQDFPMGDRKSRTNRWGLTGPSFWAIISDRDSLLSAVLTDWFSSWLSVLIVGQSVKFRARRGEIRRSRTRKCITRNALTHSHICSKIPPLGLETATLTPVAHTIAQLTTWKGEKRPPFLRHQSGTATRDSLREYDPPFSTDSKQDGGPPHRALGTMRQMQIGQHEKGRFVISIFHIFADWPFFHFPIFLGPAGNGPPFRFASAKKWRPVCRLGILSAA